MKSRLFFLSIMLLSAAAIIAGCTTSQTPVDENKHPALGHWVSDELIDNASLSYIITDEGNFTETWNYENNTWSDGGISDNGLNSYIVSYNNEENCTYYLSADESVLTDDYDWKFERDSLDNSTAKSGVEGRWIYEKPEYASHGIIVFKSDMTQDEIWDYQGAVNITGFDEENGYKLIMEFAIDAWDFNATLSSDKKTFTDSKGNLYHKKA
ncbi:MAG: hypothetical protein PHV39_09535 [Methanomicrobium sp.]|nr:hypothetical protein [Methanomicrobium sp.]